MRTVKSLKDIDNQNHTNFFTKLYRSIERKISFDLRWRSQEDGMDLSKIVLDPNVRLIMQTGEIFACSYMRNTDSHGHRTSKEKSHSPLVMFGTPYGTVVMHYLYESTSVESFLNTMKACSLHCTDSFRQAAMRFLERKPETVLLIEDMKIRKGMNIETFIKCWMLTESFNTDIAEQADIDHVNGIAVSDGFPPIVKIPKPAKAVASQRQNQQTKKPAQKPRQQQRRQPQVNPNPTAPQAAAM